MLRDDYGGRPVREQRPEQGMYLCEGYLFGTLFDHSCTRRVPSFGVFAVFRRFAASYNQ